MEAEQVRPLCCESEWTESTTRTSIARDASSRPSMRQGRVLLCESKHNASQKMTMLAENCL